MNSRERAIRALEHEEPDRVPLEGASWGQWSYPFLQKLLSHFGLGREGAHIWRLSGGTEALYRNLGIDFRPANMEPPDDFKRVAAFDARVYNPWGIPVEQGMLRDEWGIVRKVDATGSRSVIVSHPLHQEQTIDGYDFPDPNAPGRYDDAEKAVKDFGGEYAISGLVGGNGFFTRSWFLRGFEELIHDLYSNPRFAENLLDKLLQFSLATGKRLIEVGVDIICIADDVAMQTGMILSPRLWRKYIKTRMKALINGLKRRGAYILYHSDGDLGPIIPDLVEIGVDILHPIQPECLDPAEIKQLYGDKLTLAGTISVQETLPYGTVEDVRKEVMTRIKTCGIGGGLILSPSSAALSDVKVQNFLAVYDVVKKFGAYPLQT